MVRFIQILCCSLLLLSAQVIAVCSDYMGRATINEAGKVGFIEIKLLDTSISSAIYNTWNVKVCKAKNNGNADGCSEPLLLSGGSLSNDVYIVVPTDFIPNNKAFDIILIDDGGKTIDYLSVGYTIQRDNSCTLTYDWNAAVSNSHDYRRMPDGTGDWGNAGSGDSGGNTGGGPNEGEIGACSVIFPDGIQSHTDGGVLTFNNLAKLTNSPDNILDTTEDIIDGAGWQKNTCDTEDCVASGSSVSFVSYNDFPSGGSVINLSNGDDLTINPGVYESISLNNQNVLTLEAGDYQIETFFSVSDQSTIEVVDGGLARFFVQGSINLGDAIELNTASNAGKFLLYSKNNIVIGNNNIIEAFIYSEGNVTLNNQAQVNGAVTANHVTLISEAQVDFNQDVPDFGDFCDALPAENIALYRFEQTDFTTQIDDTSGNGNHAENLNGGLSTPDGKYCRGFESESWSLDDQIADAFRSSLDVDNDIGIRGAISFWFNSSIDWHQGDERILFDATLEPNIFALEITQDGRLRFAFEDSANDVFIVEEQSAVSRGSNTWYYVTVTWDYSSDTFSLYVDGALVTQQTKSTNGVMPDFARVVFGDNASSYTQSGNSVMPSPVSSRGNYDEVRIYSKVLTQSEIQADMNDDNGCPVLVAEWQMEEASWLVGGNPVIDSINGFNGIAFNGADTVGSTCRYGKFDGVDDYVEIPHDDSLNGSDTLTYVAYIRADSWSGTNQILAKSVHGGGSGRAQMGLFSEGGVFKARAETLNGRIGIQTSLPAPLGDWVHVAVVFDGTSLTLYQDGVNVASDTFSATTLVQTTDPLNISKRVGTDQYYFHGLIDEVRVYSSALTHQEIIDLMSYIKPCSLSEVDHFQIDTKDQQGITCQADEIVIKACADASCSTVNPDEVDVVLAINGTDYKAVTVSGPDGTTTTYPHTTVGNAALSLDQTYKCTNTLATTPCNVTFKDSGFIISDIPMQISGKSSDEGFNNTTLSLRAVEKNTTTGVCDNVFPDDTDVAVNLSYTCAGGDCKDLLSLSNNGNSYNLSDTASAKDLYFSNNSTANFTLKYPHAAKFILNAQKDVEVTDSDNNTIIKDFSASSNAFVERPFAFKLDFSSDTNSANAFAQDGSSNPDASKSAFKKAGATFKLTATTVQWQNGQDNSPIDGIPDDFSAIDNNPTAEHFSDGPLTIIDALLLPKVSEGGVEGTLATELSNSFVNSIITNEYNYSEVGIIKLSVNLFDGDYLGAGDILGEVTNVGRFTPAYFTQTVESHGSLNAYHYGTCSPITNDWAYAGHTRERSGSTVGAISYTDYLAPIIHISAYNLGKAITQNYTATGFMKLPASGITIPAPVEDNATARLFPTVVDEKVFISPSMSVGDEPIASATKGIVSYTFNILDHFIYEHNKHSKLPPFPASIPFLITEVEDTDLVKLYDGSDTNITATEKVITQGVEVRFGRWLLENSYGPETSPLPVTMFAQHFDGISFINNEKENCLIPVIGSKVITGGIGDAGLNLWDYRIVDLDTSDNLLPSHTAATVENKSFTAGLYQWLLFSASGINNQGSLNVEYQVPPWLQYDWNNDTNFTNNPSAKLTFGIFRGNDRIIYQREIAK